MVVSRSWDRVHLAQPFVALAARWHCSAWAIEPRHGFAEVAHLFFLLAFAFAAHHAGAFAQQAFEGVGGFGQGGVVGAVHEVLREHAAFYVAVVACG